MATELPGCSIITIGDELLIGQTIDTNSAWIGRELNKIGIAINRRVAVGDRREDILQCIESERKHSTLLILTGGLGPTADDITKPLLCDYFGGKMIVDQGALENVKNIFEKFHKKPMLERNLRQAEVPDVCTVIPNKRGTAPGMWFPLDKGFLVSLPGVPHEMKGMMTDWVIPQLNEKFQLIPIQHKTLVTAGIGESFLAERIRDFEDALPSDIKLAYLPNYGMVRLRLSLAATEPARSIVLEERFQELQKLVADVLVAAEDQSLQETVGALLREKKATLATAESCTGGYIAHLITSIPGSSQYYIGSVIAYDNSVKHEVLDVPESILSTEGAVSEATVTAMARGTLARLKSDYVVVTSGIMGPDGGSTEKPVGTVWVAVGNKDKILTQRFQFRFDRQRNIELTGNAALNMLRKFIVENL
jgi:nicotinamide-nucleotide amidase